MRQIITILFLAFFIGHIQAQAKKPTLMVVPSDNWCITNGYMMQFENQGMIETIPDYKAAFQQSSDLLLVVVN